MTDLNLHLVGLDSRFWIFHFCLPSSNTASEVLKWSFSNSTRLSSQNQIILFDGKLTSCKQTAKQLEKKKTDKRCVIPGLEPEYSLCLKIYKSSIKNSKEFLNAGIYVSIFFPPTLFWLFISALAQEVQTNLKESVTSLKSVLQLLSSKMSHIKYI